MGNQREEFFYGKKSVREIVLSGLFIDLGLVLSIVFHAFGAGSTFLSMHIPVLIAGFVVSMPFAIAVGVITPILSSVLTGMPPMFPILPDMETIKSYFKQVGIRETHQIDNEEMFVIIGEK